MNSWDCDQPSEEMRQMFALAVRARERVGEARLEMERASEVSRDFWRHVLADRIAELEALEGQVREMKMRPPRAPDALGLDGAGRAPLD